MTAHVNENCIGCGLCTNICPDVFSMTAEGVSSARDDISPLFAEQVKEAADSCPVDAIEVGE